MGRMKNLSIELFNRQFDEHFDGLGHIPGDIGYPKFPGSKEPTTSLDAAVAAAETAPFLRGEVLAALAGVPAGLTADEIADKVGKSILSIRPRVSELARMGEIVPTGERRKNESGLKAKVLRLAVKS